MRAFIACLVFAIAFATNGKGNNGNGNGNGGSNGGNGGSNGIGNGGPNENGNNGNGNGGSNGNNGGGNGNNGNGNVNNGGGKVANLFGFDFSAWDLLLANSLLGNDNNNHRNRHRVKINPPPKVLRTVYTQLVIAKCPIGSPMIGLDGLDLYCGPGTNHLDCPFGTQCITGPNQEYFACCDLPRFRG